MIPLSLYIHIPWCVKKCPYCDFNSHQANDEIPEIRYVEKLINDFEQEIPTIWGRKIQTIFIGGGTPSLFSPAAFEYLLEQLHARLAYHPDIEITLEANPGTVERNKFTAYRKLGMNRLSLGIQSFQDEKLRLLGRIHNADEAQQAIKAAKLAGFNNFNLDLMFGLPGQTIKEALLDLETAISFNPPHLSWYQLTIEPNTHFFQFPPKLPAEDYIWEMQEAGQALLAAAGYHQYEISAYSQHGFQCKHNRNYWEFGDYLGIGAGAHSKITDKSTGLITRKWKIKHPKQYLQAKEFIAGEKIIPSNELALEFMMNALRLYEPISLQVFKERTSLNLQNILRQIQKAAELGLITWNPEELATTPQGKRFLNDLLQLFA